MTRQTDLAAALKPTEIMKTHPDTVVLQMQIASHSKNNNNNQLYGVWLIDKNIGDVPSVWAL